MEVIDPKGPTGVFVSEVASTSELGGQVRHAGGAPQYLVPNRGLFTDAVRVTSLGNGPALHSELVVDTGLGALGGLATAYDVADTTHNVGRLRAQGNAAAEDHITRFATQNLGGWCGAAAGFGIGAATGVETGPGLVVTADKVADWIRDAKIDNQLDRQGNTWTFDPKDEVRAAATHKLESEWRIERRPDRRYDASHRLPTRWHLWRSPR